ncbi:MAG: RluA family pseudouridine synthase [Firmicutes bacterium]|nr:RluA family pseudouridine synthase [Bacillota bacterium]
MDPVQEEVHRVESDAGERLDRYLARHFPEHSRTAWQHLIAQGAVTVNGRPAVARHPVQPGQIIAWPVGAAALLEAELAGQGPVEGPDLSHLVIYEDDAILVVNKPRGLVVHPARGHLGDTLIEGLLHRLTPSPEAPALRPGVVHRLDRDTTGLMVVAKTETARTRLAAALQVRLVHRAYMALVRGHPHPREGWLEAPIGRDPRNRQRMAVVLGGRQARTRYRTCRVWPGYALLSVELETGRTHQIRVHLAAAGHPVVGDPLYGAGPELGFPAQALHAWRLEFHHPMTGAKLAFTAPPPEDWAPAARQLGVGETVCDEPDCREVLARFQALTEAGA